ncbi:tetratricopeptide repeat protein [Roseovarius bejariae]|uniref:tetratricopeptide repeat protein n=1 Tax=Roseovarius bejariae TaxID=2576383 RepID=UPI0031B61933
MRILSQLSPAVLLVISALFLSGCKSAEERAEEHFQSAISLVEEGDVDRAMVELRNVFDLDSGHTDARRTMAELQLERGNRRGAYRQYLFLAEKDPDDLESRINLAEMAFEFGSWDELDRHGARAEELAANDPRVEAIALVREYRAAIRDDDAAARRNLGSQADVLLSEQPKNVLLRNILMDNSIREQDFTRALAEIDWMIADDPTNSRYHKERLRVLAMLGDMSALETQLREMIKLFPDDPAHKATLIRFFLSRDNLDAAEALLRDLSIASASEDPGPTVDLIRFLMEFRDTESVRAEIEKAISERSDPVPFQIIEARFDFSLGNRTEAIAALQDVLAESDPSEQSRDIKITLAKMLLATGNEVGARTHVEEVLAEESTHPEALKMQAAWQIEADDIDAAIGGLRMALDQTPQNAEAMTLMARAYARRGQQELARDFLAQAVEASGNAPEETLRFAQVLIGEESYLPAEDILLAALRLAPSNTDILIALGQLYLRMEDFGRVRGVVDTLRRLGSERAIQAANGIEAERLNQQQGVDEAMSFLESLNNEAEATLATKISLVRARLGTGDRAGALALAEELKQETPDSEALDVVLAAVHVANDNLDTAEALYRDLLAANPARPKLWRELSRLQMRQGDREAAKALIDKGLSHTPEDADLLWAKASFQERDGNIDSAIAIYQTLYEKNSDSVVVANNLASLLATYRDDEDSLERAWTIARRLRDASAPALQDTYGWIVHRRGNSAEALPYLEAAAQGLPSDAIVQYHLGQVYHALDRPQEALVQFRNAVEIAGPTDTRPQIEDARTLVQSLQNSGTTEN